MLIAAYADEPPFLSVQSSEGKLQASFFLKRKGAA